MRVYTLDDVAEAAFDLIADYPLYAATSNISVEEAIMIAGILDLFEEEGHKEFAQQLLEKYYG